MESTRPNGPDLLRKFLEERQLDQSEAARALAVSAPTVHDWLDSAKRPRAAYRIAIEVWTGGAVPAAAWETEEERAIVNRVKPFTASAEVVG